ncbi:family 78 glycoside hydrolase catalytic domain [Consotaella aegiceratis]|uniref:family 78 glycoside hydrolase catalytic domain n=1 Tax=Consotaella aegiceratis TaxID=3097961 RepID=UPI002F41AB31
MQPLQPFDLKCEHLAELRGLNTAIPRFSWALAGEGRDRCQTAYRLIMGPDRDDVAAGRGGRWDSGKTVSDDTLLVPYGGPPLASDEVLHWSVVVWDEAGRESPPAEPRRIFTGLRPEDWLARWIARYFVLPAGREAPTDTLYDNPWQARPADHLRRSFAVEKPVERATLYASALGLYGVSLNGRRLGDEVMAPGWTDYHQRVEYQAYDATAALRSGANALGVVLGEGWYSGRVGHNQRRAGNHYGGRPAFFGQLHIHYVDGSVEVVASDEDWQTRQGPICYSDFLVGERYDARLEIDGWDRADCRIEGWQPVEAFVPEPCAPRLEATRIQPVREVAELPARLLHRTASGAAIYDLGQNIAGYMRLEATAGQGDTFVLRHAEMLTEEGELYLANLRYAVSTDTYIARGGGGETFRPRFTFHGFRYVELTAPEGFDLDRVRLTGIAIQTDAPVVGSLVTGNAMVNQLASNILWSQRGNFLSVPTDCPQRDERYGWSADAQVFWRTAGFNMDVAAFLTKWMEDLADGQSPDGAFPDVAPTKPLNPYRLTPQPGAPGWGDAPVIMAWQHYLRYGDRDFLTAHYDKLARWLAHIERANPDGIRRNAVYNNYGDWLSVGPPSDRAVVATAYWIHLADLMQKIADVLGQRQDAAGYRQLGTHLRRAFEAEFVAADGTIRGDTQTAYLLALDFDTLRPDLRAAAIERLLRKIDEADGHLQTGFLGVRHLCPVLSDAGVAGRAYDLLLKDSYPSWGFSIRHGATTIWERWDGWTPEKGFQSAAMNSFNHYAYGSVGEWLWARVAGIDWSEDDPGFRTIRFRPLFDDRIGFCKAGYRAPTGLVESEWTIATDHVDWRIVVPPNCRGVIELAAAPDAVLRDGEPLDDRESQGADGTTRLSVSSGDHRFRIARKP